MKAVWKGSISFGLINIPVKLYSVAEPKQFSFRLLCGSCKKPLRYKRWCPNCKKEVTWENVLHGFEIKKGVWKVFTREDLRKLRPKESSVIEIFGFSSSSFFDPLLFSKHYFVVPAQTKEKAYFLFREVLQATAKVAWGKMILHEKEHLIMIRVYRKGLVLTTLYYPYEIRNLEEIPELKESVKITQQEFNLAKKLINSLTKDPELEKYRDEFEDKLRKLIEGKIPREKVKPKPEKLVELLKLSIKEKK